MDATSSDSGRVIVITGAMAAGKSTVAELLADRLPRSVHVRGDAFRKMVVNGRADITPNLTPEAQRQLTLRYELSAHTADRFAAAGFDAIVQDLIIGAELPAFISRISTPAKHLIVLSPTVSALEWREEQRTKSGYTTFSPKVLDEIMRRDTARLGYWLDSSTQSPEETVTDILSNLDRSRVP